MEERKREQPKKTNREGERKKRKMGKKREKPNNSILTNSRVYFDICTEDKTTLKNYICIMDHLCRKVFHWKYHLTFELIANLKTVIIVNIFN